MQAGGQAFKHKVWEAIIGGSVPALEGVIWEIITAEVHSGRCCFRKALLLALDGSDIASEAQRNELLQRFAAQSGAGDTDAQCFIGILLCFQGGHDGNEFVMPAHGVKFLHAAAERHNNLATLLLALCFECGKGVEVSTDAAKQCYNMAASRGYQMAQIFLKELVRDTTFASQQLQQQQQQQQQLQQMQSTLQAANLNLLGTLGAYNANQGGLNPNLNASQLRQLSVNQQLPQGGAQNTSALAGLNLSQLNQLNQFNQLGNAGSANAGQPGIRQELLEQQVSGARKRLQAAVQDRDRQALAAAVDWAQEVSSSTGHLVQELAEARSILTFCRENDTFPELPGATSMSSRAPSPSPSHRSTGPGLESRATPRLEEKEADANPAVGAADVLASPAKSARAGGEQPTAAEKGEAFFQQESGIEVPLEPLEQDVDKTPSEQPVPPDAGLDDLDGQESSTPTRPAKDTSPEPQADQHASPAVAIPPKRGSSSHGSIGDRRQLSTSVAESEPPLTQQALEQLNRANAAGSRSAPASHKDPLDQMSIASLASLQPRKETDPPVDSSKLFEAAGKQPNAGSTGAPSPASTAPPTMDLAALKLSGGKLPPLDKLVTSEGLALLVKEGVSLEALEHALASTSDPVQLERYVRGICQILEAADKQPPAPAAPAPAAASAPPSTTSSAPPQEDWGKLMQALQANITGLEGEPLNDYLHNLRTLCGEDPSNDMVTPPSQSMPGVDAILNALQGANQHQQAAALRAASAGRPQNPAQLAAQLRSQQALGQQAPNQLLPLHLQGLSGDLTARFPGGLSQAAFNPVNPGQGLGNPLAYSQAGLASRRYSQPLGGNLGQPGMQDLSNMLDQSRLQSSLLQARPQLAAQRAGALGASAMGRQPQPSGYDQLWGTYAGKQGGVGTNPGLLGGGLKPNSQLPNSLAGNRYQPGLPPSHLPPDLQRAMLSQGGGNLGGGLGGMGQGGGWSGGMSQGGLGQPGGLGGMPGSSMGMGSQPLGSKLLGGAVGNARLQNLQGYNAAASLQGNAGTHQMAGAHASLQALQAGQALQGLRLDANQTPQSLAHQGSTSQAFKPEPPGPGAASYSLFKPAASLPPGTAPNNLSGSGIASQQSLDSLWGGGMGSQLRAPSPFAPPNASSDSSPSAKQPPPGPDSKQLDLTKDAELQAKVRSWASTGMLSASQGLLNSTSSGTEQPPAMTSWSSSDGLQQLQNKGQVRPGQYVGLGGDDSLAQAFRQRPPRAAAPPSNQLAGTRASNPMGLMNQPNSLAGMGSGDGLNLGSGLSSGGSGLLDLGTSGSGGLGFSSGLGAGLNSSSALGGFGGGLSSVASSGALGWQAGSLTQPRPGRFPGQGF